MKVRRFGSPVRDGVAAVELALLLPILCFLFVISVDFARVFYFDLTVENCARCGAIYGGRHPNAAVDTAGIQAEAKKDAGNLDTTQLQVNSTTDSSTAPTVVTVTVTYPFTTITHYPGVPNKLTLSRTVQAQVAPARVNAN
jgi:Flp pilus assembly protein TadG